MIVGRQSCDTRKLEGSSMDVGNPEFGGVEALVVFDDVFVPNERIFLNGETEFAGMLVERFAGYHRQSFIKVSGWCEDVLHGLCTMPVSCAAYGCSARFDKQKNLTHLHFTSK